MKLLAFALFLPLAFAETVQNGESRQLRRRSSSSKGRDSPTYNYGYNYCFYNPSAPGCPQGDTGYNYGTYYYCLTHPYTTGCPLGDTGYYPGYYYPGYRYPGYSNSYYYCLHNPGDVQNCPQRDYQYNYCWYNPFDRGCPDFCRIFPGWQGCPGVRPPLPDADYMNYRGKDPDFFLNHCEADCDTTRDCLWPYVCFHRHDSEPGVPGCLPPHSGEPERYADYWYVT